MFDKDMWTIIAGSKPTIVDKAKPTVFHGSTSPISGGVRRRYLTGASQ